MQVVISLIISGESARWGFVTGLFLAEEGLNRHYWDGWMVKRIPMDMRGLFVYPIGVFK